MGELRSSRWKDVSLDEVVSDTDFAPERVIDRDGTPDAQLEQGSLLAAMQRSIEHDLTEKQRTALLAELKGMPQEEIARQLGSNRNEARPNTSVIHSSTSRRSRFRKRGWMRRVRKHVPS